MVFKEDILLKVTPTSYANASVSRTISFESFVDRIIVESDPKSKKCIDYNIENRGADLFLNWVEPKSRSGQIILDDLYKVRV